MVEEEDGGGQKERDGGGRKGGREGERCNTHFIFACATCRVQNRGYLWRTGAHCR